jgi:hypothetical protein
LGDVREGSKVILEIGRRARSRRGRRRAGWTVQAYSEVGRKHAFTSDGNSSVPGCRGRKGGSSR